MTENNELKGVRSASGKPVQKRILYVVLSVFVYTVVCSIALSFARFQLTWDWPNQSDTATENMLKIESTFPQPDPVVILLRAQPGQSVVSSDVLQDLDRVVSEIKNSGYWTVRSVVDASYVQDDGKVVQTKKLWLGADGGERFLNNLRQQTLFHGLYINKQENAWVIYLYGNSTNKDEGMAFLESLSVKEPNLIFGGDFWYDALFFREAKSDLWPILAAAMILLIAVLLFLLRSLRATLLLAVSAFLPALGSLAACPILGFEITSITAVGPILLMALSTVYGLHVYHYWLHVSSSVRSLWRDRGQVVFWSGFSSVLGFMSLLISQVHELQVMGICILIGMVLLFCWNLVGLPIVLSGSIKWREARTTREHLKPVRTVSPPKLKIGPIPVRSLLIPLIVISIIPAIFAAKIGINVNDSYWPWTKNGENIRNLQRVIPDWRQAALVVNFRKDDALVEPQSFYLIDGLERRLKQQHWIGKAWAYTDIVKYQFFGAEGAENGPAGQTAQKPLNTEDIADAMETTPRDNELGKLFDSSYSQAVIRVTINDDDSSTSEWINRFEAFRTSELAANPGLEFTWIGAFPRSLIVQNLFIEGQIQGLGLYFGITAVLVFLRVRSLRKSFLILLPPLFAVAAVLGFCGLVGLKISPPLALVLAEGAGISIDDAYLWYFLSKDSQTRRSILESTIIIAVTSLALLFSSFMHLGVLAVLVAVSMFVSTGVVLWTLPWQKKESA